MLQNYDEFITLQALQNIDINNEKVVEKFKLEHHLSDNDFATLKSINVPAERKI